MSRRTVAIVLVVAAVVIAAAAAMHGEGAGLLHRLIPAIHGH